MTMTRPLIRNAVTCFEASGEREIRWNAYELAFTLPLSLTIVAPGILGLVSLIGSRPSNWLVAWCAVAALLVLPFFVWAIWPLFLANSVRVSNLVPELHITHGFRWSPSRIVLPLCSVCFEVRHCIRPHSRQRDGVCLYLCKPEGDADSRGIWITANESHENIISMCERSLRGKTVRIADNTLEGVQLKDG
jgi:hypothetical protein